MISEVCNSCGKLVRAEDDEAGLMVQCPHCQAEVDMPAALVKRCYRAVPKKQENKLVLSMVILGIYIALGVLQFMYAETNQALGMLFFLGLIMCIGLGAAKKRLLFGILLGITVAPIGVLVLAFVPPAEDVA